MNDGQVDGMEVIKDVKDDDCYGDGFGGYDDGDTGYGGYYCYGYVGYDYY